MSAVDCIQCINELLFFGGGQLSTYLFDSIDWIEGNRKQSVKQKHAQKTDSTLSPSEKWRRSRCQFASAVDDIDGFSYNVICAAYVSVFMSFGLNNGFRYKIITIGYTWNATLTDI